MRTDQQIDGASARRSARSAYSGCAAARPSCHPHVPSPSHTAAPRTPEGANDGLWSCLSHVRPDVDSGRGCVETREKKGAERRKEAPGKERKGVWQTKCAVLRVTCIQTTPPQASSWASSWAGVPRTARWTGSHTPAPRSSPSEISGGSCARATNWDELGAGSRLCGCCTSNGKAGEARIVPGSNGSRTSLQPRGTRAHHVSGQAPRSDAICALRVERTEELDASHLVLRVLDRVHVAVGVLSLRTTAPEGSQSQLLHPTGSPAMRNSVRETLTSHRPEPASSSSSDSTSSPAAMRASLSFLRSSFSLSSSSFSSASSCGHQTQKSTELLFDRPPGFVGAKGASPGVVFFEDGPLQPECVRAQSRRPAPPPPPPGSGRRWRRRSRRRTSARCWSAPAA